MCEVFLFDLYVNERRVTHFFKLLLSFTIFYEKGRKGERVAEWEVCNKPGANR